MHSRRSVALVALLGCMVLAPLTLAQQVPARPADTLATGERVYGKWCSDCHSTATGPGSIALQRQYHGNPAAILLQRTNLSPDLVKAAVRNGVSFMPSFRKTEITDTELAALAGYMAAATRPAPAGGKRP